MFKYFEKYFDWINMENIEFLENLLSLLENGTEEELKKAGGSVYERGINFAELSIVLDRFSFVVNNKEKYKKNREYFTYGYLQKRLPKEIELVKKGIHNNPSLVSSKDIDIINELLSWLEKLINSFVFNSTPPDINGRFEKFQSYVEERKGVFFEDEEVKENFLEVNKKLYELAELCVKFYKDEEYFYFMLSFIDLMAQFLKMVTLLSGMFLESELLSIYIDPVTLLPNRFQLIKDVKVIGNCYILIVNIIGFSKINILYGFDAGDIILKRLAAYLQPRSIKAYRIYGDEFAVLLNSEEEIKSIFNKLNDLEIHINGDKIHIYFYGAYSKFENKALEVCEFALGKSDKKGLINSEKVKNLMDSYKKDLTIAQKLKEAMIKDNIIPYFQPIYITKPIEKILKYEVLMRVKFEDEILSPAEFLPVLKTLPIYTEFTKSVLLKSFELFKNNDLTFSINFTLTDLKDKNLFVFLKLLIEKYPEVAKRFTIEITESEAIDEFDLINEYIKKLKKYGVTFALDDFGSGYSNFTQVAKLDVDFIKIDGSIIQEVLKSDRMKMLFESIVAFAKKFNLSTVAEFVSNKELFDYLHDKVDMMQGFYIGKPEPYLLSE